MLQCLFHSCYCSPSNCWRSSYAHAPKCQVLCWISVQIS